MKRLVIIIIVMMVIWNAFLTSMIFERKGADPQTEHIVNEITVNGYTTDFTKMIEDAHSKMVRVDDATTSRSGYVYDVINDEVIIVTYLLNLKLDEPIAVVFDNLQRTEARFVGYDEASNLAVLATSPNFEVSPFTKGSGGLLKQGEFAIALGSSLDDFSEAALSIGFITTSLKQSETQAVSKASLVINEKMLGGAVLNMGGDLIGFAHTITPLNQNASFLPINEVNVIVDKIINKKIINRQALGLELVEISRLSNYQKSALSISLNASSGLYVASVKEDSKAAISNVKAGMIINKVNGQAINDIFDYHNVLYDMQSEVTLVGSIGQDNVTITVALHD